MNDKTKIILARMACGTAILITHAVTGYNGVFLAIGLFLLGVPVEYAKTAHKEDV